MFDSIFVENVGHPNGLSSNGHEKAYLSAKTWAELNDKVENAEQDGWRIWTAYTKEGKQTALMYKPHKQA